MADYKVEVKPTLWEVVVSHGSYSDAGQENFFISANDRDEAWFLFKRYWQTEFVNYTWSRPGLVYSHDNRHIENFAPDGWKDMLRSKYAHRLDGDFDWDTDEGWANSCELYNVNVIRFKK